MVESDLPPFLLPILYEHPRNFPKIWKWKIRKWFTTKSSLDHVLVLKRESISFSVSSVLFKLKDPFGASVEEVGDLRLR